MRDKYKVVGEKIKKERIKYGLSLNELAEATGLSSSFLSLIENGKAVPSLKALDKVATCFNIHIASFFMNEEVKKDWIVLPKEEQIEVVNEGERVLRFVWPKNSFGDGVLITLQPHATNRGFTTHNGAEMGYVLEGEITIVFKKEEEKIVLKKGDSIFYNANIPHRLINEQDSIARGFWVNLNNVESIEDYPPFNPS